MRAIQYVTTGSARDVLRLVELPDPAPTAGEVLVRLTRSAVNPSDVKRRAAVPGQRLATPQIPHQDGAGVVVDRGSDVQDIEIGARVWVREAALGRASGTAAELIALPYHLVHPVTGTIDDDAAACLAIPCLTAHAALQTMGGSDLSGLEGRTVLVTGAGGAVGNAAVQFAHLAGARTIAIAGDAARRDLAGGAGADVVLDRTSPDLGADLRGVAPGGIDLAVDVAFLANADRYAEALSPGATIVAMSSDGDGPLPIRPLMHGNITVRFLLVYSLPEDVTRAAIDGTERLITHGYVPLPVRRLDLTDAAEAHELVERGTTGRVLLELD